MTLKPKTLFTSIAACAIAMAMQLANVQAQQVALPKSAAEVPGPAPGPMTKDYVLMVGRMAYFWGWPLVNAHNQRSALSRTPEPVLLNGVLPIAPLNTVAMLTDFISPAAKSVAAPNHDVVYGLANLALEKEPVVVQVPDFGDRFWTLPVFDARTDQIGELGRQYGSKPGFYLIAGPGWKGETPSGVAGVVRLSVNFGVAAPRIALIDTPEDHAAIQAPLSQIQIYPLSQFDGTMKTKDWSAIPKVERKALPQKFSTAQPPWVDPEKFFDQLPLIMKEVPPLPGEEALYKQIAAVLHEAAKDPEVMKTLREAASAADPELIAPMMQWRFNGQPAGNGWTSPANNGAFGTDYFHRTGAMKTNPYGARRTEMMSFFTDIDSSLQPLVGEASYIVTFPKDALPPVKGFWSLTLYDPDHSFAPNGLFRFALGSRDKALKYDDDGSLTLYLGHKSPGAARDSNWLPAPAGTFSIWLRAYWPDRAILDGTWKPPVVRRLP
jgi:hypothetical protein